MAGKKWREGFGGKEKAGRFWRERKAGRFWRERKGRTFFARKNMREGCGENMWREDILIAYKILESTLGKVAMQNYFYHAKLKGLICLG